MKLVHLFKKNSIIFFIFLHSNLCWGESILWRDKVLLKHKNSLYFISDLVRKKHAIQLYQCLFPDSKVVKAYGSLIDILENERKLFSKSLNANERLNLDNFVVLLEGSRGYFAEKVFSWRNSIRVSDTCKRKLSVKVENIEREFLELKRMDLFIEGNYEVNDEGHSIVEYFE